MCFHQIRRYYSIRTECFITRGMKEDFVGVITIGVYQCLFHLFIFYISYKRISILASVWPLGERIGTGTQDGIAIIQILQYRKVIAMVYSIATVKVKGIFSLIYSLCKRHLLPDVVHVISAQAFYNLKRYIKISLKSYIKSSKLTYTSF